MTLTTSNLTLPGPAKVYVGTASTAVPANTIAYGVAWSGTWVEVGLTLGGAGLQLGMEKTTAKSDQYGAGHFSVVNQVSCELTFDVAETTLTNLKQALGYGTLTAGSTESTYGVSSAETFVVQKAFGVESYAPAATSASAKYSRFVIWIGEPKGDAVEVTAAKDTQRVYRYTVEAMVDTSQTSTEALWKLIERQN